KDIDKAREIQQSILPEPYLKFHHYELYGMSVPDRIVGGDFFDYLFADEEKDRLVVVLGDAASKGLKAAAQAMYLAGGIRTGISFHTKISSLMGRMNTLLHRTFSEDQFVSMFYAEFSMDKRGLVLYSNAGHNSPILCRAEDGSVDLLEPTGQILGPFPDEKYRVENTVMQTGDVLVMYSDGISEARDTGEGQYGEKRLTEKILESRHLKAEQICRSILDDVHRFSRGSDEGDDRTIVVVKREH
ncbi:MAG: PP2C family protein-serine/threonine phosphatase, partial [Bacteroidota bacterium]